MMIKVLIHITPNITGITKDYIEQVSAQLTHNINIDICTRKSQLSEYNVLHIIGNGDNRTMQLIHSAEKLHRPVVYSPFGALYNWQIKSKSLPLRLFYKNRIRQIIKASTLINVIGEIENELFSDCKKSVERVDCSLLTNTIDVNKTARGWYNIYIKALNIMPVAMISTKDKAIIFELLLSAIDEECYKDAIKQTVLQHEINSFNWKYILFYALKEGVLDLLLKGMRRLSIFNEVSKIVEIPNETQIKENKISNLQSDALVKALANKSELVEDIKDIDDEVVREITILTLNLREYTNKGKTPLLYLLDLYRVIRLKTYNETYLLRVLKEQKLLSYFLDLQSLMSEVLYLSEGFMPVPNKGQRDTKTLSQKIVKI